MGKKDKRDWVDRVDRVPFTEEKVKRAREGLLKLQEERARQRREREANT